MATNKYLEKAIRIAGSQSELARRIGVKQQYIWYWLHKAKAVPAEYVAKIEAATDSRVTRYQLRPDVFGNAA